jgi:hypothetical protein
VNPSVTASDVMLPFQHDPWNAHDRFLEQDALAGLPEQVADSVLGEALLMVFRGHAVGVALIDWMM